MGRMGVYGGCLSAGARGRKGSRDPMVTLALR
jgi:hypothetical protein